MTSFNGGAAAMAYWLFSRNRSPFSPETDHHSPAVDQHGDVRYLMDVTGAVTDTYDYDAADFHENDHRFHLKSINDFTLGDHYRSEATLACLILR
jgi:hypothetical protein